MNRAFRYACVSALVLILAALVGCGFHPNQPTLQSIVVTSTSASMIRGTTQQLLATGQYNNGSSQQLTNQVTWTSSNPAIATVSPSGLVTGVATGSVTIGASVGTVSGQSTISVEIHLTSISITGTPSVQRGQTQQLTATGKYDDGSSAAVTAAWTSSNTAVATVAGGGVVTGVTMGTTTITATAGGFSANTAFNVNGVATGTVNETGGTINVTGNTPVAGASVVVPAGAVEAGTTVTINVDYETTPPGPLPAGVTQSSQVLVLEKNSPYDFKLPLTITIPADATALAAGDVPVVFYWNDTYQNYEAASLVGIDTTNNTVSFQTVHFSRYMGMHGKGGWTTNNGKTVDTGFRPDVDGFFHPNFGSYVTPGGSSLGMSLFASWYYADKKQKDGHGLYSKYLEADVTRWQDDVTARELISRTYAASAVIWAKLAQHSPSTLTPADTAQALLTAMSSTNVPQVVILRGTSSWAQAVLIYGWDKDLQRFKVYDPNFPGDKTVTLGWDSTGPIAYSKAGGYPDAIKSAEFHGMSIALATTEFEQLYAGAEAGFHKSLFSQITVTEPTLDANDTVIVQDGNGLSVKGNVSEGSKTATKIAYCLNGDCSFAPVSLSGNAFSLSLPTLTQGTNNIMLIATSDARNPWQAFVGFKQFTIKIQGKVFFANAGFETGDWTGWTHETHTWGNPTPGSFNPEKSTIVQDVTLLDPLVETFCTSNPTSCNTSLTQGYVGNHAARINNQDNMYHISTATQTVTVPNMSNPQVRFYWAAVLQDPGHTWCAQPYVEVKVEDLDDLVPDPNNAANQVPKKLYFEHFAAPNTNEGLYCDRSGPDYGKTTPYKPYSGWKTIYPYYASDPWQVIEWQTVILQGVVGHQMKVTVTAGDCAWSGHGGYAYLDGDE